MAELTTRERRQPCLLDRLTDEEPGVAQESRDRRVISVPQLRRGVLRDLEWLLNSSTRFTPDEAEEFPLAAASVLNYGLPDLCGLTASNVDPKQIERMIQTAVLLYEPRVMRRSIEVDAVARPDEMGPNAVAFVIRGQLWAQPMPEPLYLKTDVDLETGHCTVEDRPNG
jgi:type VI secretion system protein ImpF